MIDTAASECVFGYDCQQKWFSSSMHIDMISSSYLGHVKLTSEKIWGHQITKYPIFGRMEWDENLIRIMVCMFFFRIVCFFVCLYVFLHCMFFCMFVCFFSHCMFFCMFVCFFRIVCFFLHWISSRKYVGCSWISSRKSKRKVYIISVAQSVGAVEYTDCVSVEGYDPATIVLDMTVNNLMLTF